MRIYVRYHALPALETMARAGDRLGLNCPDGWKKAARQTRLPLVLGVTVPAISPRISPTTVNICVYAAYRTSSLAGPDDFRRMGNRLVTTAVDRRTIGMFAM